MKMFFVLAIAGVVLVFAGLRLVNPALDFVAGAKTAQGKVVGVAEKPAMNAKGKKHTAFVPTVAFHVDGKDYQIDVLVAAGEQQYEVGEAVEVLYDPADPRAAKLNHPGSLYGLPFAMIVLGAVCLLLAFGLMVRARAAL